MKSLEGPCRTTRMKPRKPRHDYPLQAHLNGQWSKKINGTRRYFGAWSDPRAAEALYWKERDDWESGRNPRTRSEPSGEKELWELVDRWLVMRKSLLTVDDVHARIQSNTFKGSKAAVEFLMELTGKRSNPVHWSPEDFRNLRLAFGANGVSPATKGQRIMYVRALFDWCVRARLIPRLPDYGDQFDGVSKAEKELHRYEYQREHGERGWNIETARQILRAWTHALNARPHACTGSHVEWRDLVSARLMRACSYLAANTGANSRDIGELASSEIDLERAYVERLREKTAILWQATLWPETVDAIREYLEVRPGPAREQWRRLVFLTSDGYPVNHGEAAVEDGETDNRTDTLRQNTSKLLVELGIKAKGVTFGAWRSTFRTLASDALGIQIGDIKRVDAINRIMAHSMPGVSNRYVRLTPDQLRVFTDAVRAKLWPVPTIG